MLLPSHPNAKRVQITCGVRRQEGTAGSHNLACLDLIRDAAGPLQSFFFLIGSISPVSAYVLWPLWPWARSEKGDPSFAKCAQAGKLDQWHSIFTNFCHCLVDAKICNACSLPIWLRNLFLIRLELKHMICWTGRGGLLILASMKILVDVMCIILAGLGLSGLQVERKPCLSYIILDGAWIHRLVVRLKHQPSLWHLVKWCNDCLIA